MACWRAGDRVVVRGERWTVLETTPFADCDALRLARSIGAQTITRTFLLPFDRPRQAECATELRAVKPRAGLHHVRRAALDAHPFGALRDAARCSIDLLPYQLEPALAVLRYGWPRVLIADAVGLGKTIQAGLIANELRARTSSARVLVLAPAGLRAQWARELDRRFGLHVVEADSSWLRAIASKVPADVNPWALPGVYVASHDFVKRPEVLRPLEDLRWDLLVVDEAHAVTAGSDRRAAIDALACRAGHVVLLTATPHDADGVQRAALLRLGTTGDGSPLIVFRRTRSTAGPAAPRRSTLLAVHLTEAERRMHRLLEAYTGRVWREASARGDAHARLASIVLRKRALSSAASLALSLRRRMELLADPSPAPETQLVLPLQDEDPLEDAEPLAALAAPGLTHQEQERRWLALVLQAALHAARHESKLLRLARLLHRMREPAIVFTEYRDTLVRLRDALASRGLEPVLLHGGMSPADRLLSLEAFDTGTRLLLATDAAAEGLNLQKRCRTVIHYELPWNPARLEQRAGRVDRIGQRRRAHEIALVAADTAERIVLAPVMRRAAESRRSTAPLRLLHLLTESRIAAEILGGTLPRDAPDGDPDDLASCDSRLRLPDVSEEGRVEAARLERHRRWAASIADPHRHGARAVAFSLRCRGRQPEIAFAYVLSVRDGDGGVQHAEAIVLRAGIRCVRLPRSAAGVRALAQRLRSESHRWLDDVLRAQLSGCLERTRAGCAAAEDFRILREREVREVRASAARQLVQAGLFERRPRPGHTLRPAEDAVSECVGDGRALSADSRLVAVIFLEDAS